MTTSIGQKAFQGVAAGIGLVSESISAHKAKKQDRSGQEQSKTSKRGSSSPVGSDNPPSYELQAGKAPHAEEAAAEFLEEQWALDEAQEELLDSSKGHASENRESQEKPDSGSLTKRFLSRYPAPSPYTPTCQLYAPVVLPQRRPKNRDRGFIRAYAPALADCGIDQTMFIDFLDTAEKACQARPWLNAINLASIGTIWLPSVTGIAVSIAIQITTDIAIAADGRRNTNNFFTKANQEFFQPRGLYCLVLTWNPELPDAPATTIDLNSLVSKAAGGGGSAMLGRLQHKFKSSDGKGYGNIFPEVAPLVFPEIDQLASDQDGKKKLSGLKKKREFVGGYLDKRAQAKFTAKNPDSYLNQGPAPTFTSRYADPNHPASSGDPLALITGGHLTMETLRGGPAFRGRRGDLMQDQYDSRWGSNSNPPAPQAPYGRPFGLRSVIGDIREMRCPQNGTHLASGGAYGLNNNRRNLGPRGALQNVGPLTPIAKLMKKKVLYLAIVSMPPEDEMNRAREALGQM